MPRLAKMAICSLLAVSVAGCADTREIDQAPAAKVEAPAKVEPAAPAKAVQTVELKVDPAHSTIGFLGAKVTRTHQGGFKDFDGSVTLAGDQVVGTRFTVQTASLWADAEAMSEKLTGHLESPEFFDVEKYPEATFTSSSLTHEGDGPWDVKGNLALHGVDKEITFPATITVTPEAVTAKADFKINRSDWGLSYPGKPDDLIKEEVKISLDLSFPRKVGPAPAVE